MILIELTYLQSVFRKLLDSLPSEVETYFIEYIENEAIEREINELIRTKDFKKAMKLVQSEVNKFPYSLESRLLIAKLYFASGQHRHSLIALEETESYHPFDTDILRLKASNWLSIKMFDKAQEAYKKLLSQESNPDAELLWEVGYCYESKNSLSTAASFYQKALQKDPSHHKSLNSLISCSTNLGQIELLLNFLQQQCSNEPLKAYHWYNYSAALLANAQYDEAEEGLRDALALTPDKVQFISALANLLCYKGEAQEALELYQEIEKIEKVSPSSLCLKAFCMEVLKKYRDALSFYRQATELDPHFPWAWYGLGKNLNLLKKHHEAIFFLKKAIVLNPSCSDYWFALGIAERDSDNFTAAQEALLQATYLEDESPNPWLELAYTYYLAEMKDQALDTIMEGLEVIPQSSELNYLAGAYLYLKGKIKEGSIYMQTAASINIDGHEILFKYFPELEYRLAFLKVILGVNMM